MSKKRQKNQGRHYADSEWPEFVMDGMADGEGLAEGVERTREVEEQLREFEKAAARAVADCSKRFPPEDEIELDDGALVDIYHTLVGAGVGIWDGRWDVYYPDYTDDDWDRLTACLKKHLRKFADDSGGGSLNDAFRDAVYVSASREDNPDLCQLKNVQENPDLRQLKNKLLK